MLTPRYVKNSKLLARHAQKYLRYKRDILEPASYDLIAGDIRRLKAALASVERWHWLWIFAGGVGFFVYLYLDWRHWRSSQAYRPEIERHAEALDAKLHELLPVTWESHWRENCEVILVAIVVAIGIRSYFLQPFKIPTGSMQPTLNGIIGYPSTTPAPNILRQIGEFIILGRNYIDVVSREDDQVFEIEPKKILFFFTFSRLICGHQNFLVYAPPDTLTHDFSVIPGIREDPEAGSPFYIKRLAGLPGDHLRIDPPFLYVNGEKAEGFGFARVMAAKPPYRGYAQGHDYLGAPNRSFAVPAHGYFALGDNSYNSYDSRYWGPVPEENLVGRGLLVYWPFNHHWGLIR